MEGKVCEWDLNDGQQVLWLGGEEERATEGEEGTEALVINVCRGDVHRSAANAHIMRRCRPNPIFTFTHLRVFQCQRPPVTPPSTVPLSLSPALLDDNLSLPRFFPFPLVFIILSPPLLFPRPTPPPDPPKISPRSHASGRVLIHIITSFSKKYNTAFHFWGDTATYQCLRAL